MRIRFKPNKIRFSPLWSTVAVLVGIFTLLASSSYSRFVYAEGAKEPNGEEIVDKYFSQNSKISKSDNLNVVRVISGNEVKYFLTSLVNTSNILEKMGITVDEDDIVFPELSKNIDSNNTIKITFVEQKYTEATEPIPFQSIVEQDPDLTVKQRIVSQEGQDGVKKIVYLSRYENGQEVSKEYFSAHTVQPAINEIIKVAPPRNVPSQRNCPMWNSVIDELTSDERVRTILKGIIICESHCNQTADNGYYFGLMQFNKATFKTYGGSNIWDGKDQLETALRIYEKGGEPNMAWHWPVCYKHAVGIN